ncbi:glycosyltransferase [Flavobacterium columnare]|uniref:Glycosyltransferase n=1 Tax=Flavobacterium columnare TaxID=996 RepID=A0AAI8CJH4_9FLAO|nr:glycosyltransferase [Flavobacterium columnare]AMO21191.1 glycosyltransferase [Flavobacterium columnare]AUX19206.1 glycosyl transferase [Flavobacterium columnare]MEB3802233.1 glycosyltransferase [Flavobacterium columnare]QOG58291.1 glycosyltransferase [Flavobacterium columnare]QOG61014.1 glycosyltransferase [Flavobacterium columnare]
MKFVVITHVQHIEKKGEIYGYAPYIREMNLWIKNTDELILVAPKSKEDIDPIWLSYEHKKKKWLEVPNFNLTSFKAIAHFIISLPILIYLINKGFRKADHIHLRCPGNMGLLGAIIQIFFPKKKKTAKYAGNWDPNAKQPWSYKLQKWILSNTFLTRNMQVLVYGEWPNQTSNIKPFFTATYSEEEIRRLLLENVFEKGKINLEANFLFVGTLSRGKRPLYALKLVEKLIKTGIKAKMEFYGEGELSNEIIEWIKKNNLSKKILVKGNQSKETIIEAYQRSHFLILPSKSEGWPKVVAEAMIFKCIPIVTPISCVPFMIAKGERGIILSLNLDEDAKTIKKIINNEIILENMAFKGTEWSKKITVDQFENEIMKLIN